VAIPKQQTTFKAMGVTLTDKGKVRVTVRNVSKAGAVCYVRPLFEEFDAPEFKKVPETASGKEAHVDFEAPVEWHSDKLRSVTVEITLTKPPDSSDEPFQPKEFSSQSLAFRPTLSTEAKE
jgi:hypothetical protein